MKEYININEMQSVLYSLLKDAIKNFGNNDAEIEYLNEILDDEELKEIAQEDAKKINSDMCEYLHKRCTHIDGYFADIQYDYGRFDRIYYDNGKYRFGPCYDEPIRNFDEMVKRLDECEQSKEAEFDRNFLTDWFFYCFGTWAYQYKFQEFASEILCSYEEENAVNFC